MITQKLVNAASSAAEKEKLMISDITIGLRYVIVLLSNGESGVSAIIDNDFIHSFNVQKVDGLIGGPAADCAKLAVSPNPLEAEVGIACVNALLNKDISQERVIEGNIIDILQISKDETVGVVGAFFPILPMLNRLAKEVFVFEKHPALGVKNMYPDWSEKILLPQCDIAIISATTLINKTLDDILSYVKSSARTVLLGPSAPLVSKYFAGSGIDFLSGNIIPDYAGLKNIISHGGGTRKFGKTVTKLNIQVTK